MNWSAFHSKWSAFALNGSALELNASALATIRSALDRNAGALATIYGPNVLFTSGCFAISRSARPRSVFPGSILCHGDAPLGCGSGTTSAATPWYVALRTVPMRSFSFSFVAEHLLDRHRPDRQDELRLQDRRLAREERAAPRDLVRVGPTVAPAGRLPREAARDRRDVDLRAKLLFADAERLFEPAKQRLPGRPRERAPEPPFARTGSLPDEEDAARDRRPVDHRANHVRAGGAGVELGVKEAELADGSRSACHGDARHHDRRPRSTSPFVSSTHIPMFGTRIEPL